MKLTFLALPLAVVAFVGAARLTSAAGPAPADTAETVDYTFRELPLGSMGIKTLSELRGKPVVIDFWGQH